MQDAGCGKRCGSVGAGVVGGPEGGCGRVCGGVESRYVAVLNRAVEACRTDAAVGEEFDVAELYLELTMACQSLGRFDEATAAAGEAITAGLVMRPDARCLRAEVLMGAGRVAEAAPIWAAVRAECPDDVWLYNNAGLEYADVGEHETALGWLTEGLQLALRTGDPERLIDQLTELRADSLHALGQPADELQRHAVGFGRHQAHARAARTAVRESEAPPDRSLHAHGGAAGPGGGALAWAWVPAEDYAAALALWPDLADGLTVTGPAGSVPSHEGYCRALQTRLMAAAHAGAHRVIVAPVRVAAFQRWCTQHRHQPDAAARAQYVATLAGRGDARVIGWPPGRNQPCWCGSGRKYKKCCAAPAPAPSPVR
jgi:SEC-C motif